MDEISAEMRKGSSKRRWLMAWLVLLATAVVWWLAYYALAGRTTSTVEHARQRTPATEAATNAAVTLSKLQPSLMVTRRHQPSPGTVAQYLAPLPPVGTKVADVLARLRDAADHGDVRAACRVGLELARCRNARRSIIGLTGYYDQAMNEHASADEIAQRLGILNEAKSRAAPDILLCQGVDDADANEAWSYLLQSAVAGSAAAAAYFFSAPPTAAFVDESDVLDQWAQHREEFRDMGIRSGDVYTLNAAMVSSSMGVGWGGRSRSFPKDPYRAVEYATALTPLVDPESAEGLRKYIGMINADLSPDQMVAAQKEGDALRQQYFSKVATVTNANQSGTIRAERCAGSQ